MAKRARRHHRANPRAELRSPDGAVAPVDEPEPERLLLDQIVAGELDEHLVAIAEAVRARRELLHTVNSAKALATLTLGDHVRINRNASPQYLRGLHGVVVGLDQYAAVIRVNRPIGRFTGGEIRCPPLALDRLSPAA